MLNKLMTASKITEIDATTKLIIDAYTKKDLSVDAYLSEVFVRLTVRNKALSEAIRQDFVESELDGKDITRDEFSKSAYYLLMGFERHPDEVISTAALTVKKVFDKYGIKMINETYTVQSSLQESLLADLLEPDIQAHINELPSLAAVFDALKLAQTDFSDTMLKYKADKSKLDEQESATIIKKQVCDIVNNDVVLHLRAMVRSNKALYGDLALTVAKIIDSNNTTVKNRRKVKA